MIIYFIRYNYNFCNKCKRNMFFLLNFANTMKKYNK